MKVAALDLGTNSFLCLIAEGQDGQIQKILSDEVEIVRLGEGVAKNKMFAESALARAEKTLSHFKKSIERYKVDKILACATSAARDVGNGSKLFEIGKKLNIPIETISGNREAELTFKGSFSSKLKAQFSPEDFGLVVDIGGGSTELILGQSKGSLKSAQSLDVGAVRMTEKYISKHPISEKELHEAKQEIEKQLDIYLKSLGSLKTKYAIAVAGTPTALVKAIKGCFVVEEVEGYFLSKELLSDWLEKLTSRSVQERIDQLNVEAGRADILPMGVLILSCVVQKMDLPGVYVSTQGVRYGLASELLQN